MARQHTITVQFAPDPSISSKAMDEFWRDLAAVAQSFEEKYNLDSHSFFIHVGPEMPPAQIPKAPVDLEVPQ